MATKRVISVLSPQCCYYGRCGGCQGQHIPVEMQRKAKEKSSFSRLSKTARRAYSIMPMDLWRK